MSEWISVKKELPDFEDGEYLVFFKYGKIQGIKTCKWFGIKTNGRFVYRWLNPAFSCKSVTHWMPLPNPPRE